MTISKNNSIKKNESNSSDSSSSKTVFKGSKYSAVVSSVPGSNPDRNFLNDAGEIWFW